MDALLMVLAVFAGVSTAAQAGMNSQLAEHWAGSAVLAAFVSFCIGTLALAAFLLVTRTPIPQLSGKTLPWHWLGGLCGAYLVAMTAILAPRIGAAAMMSLILAGQLAGALMLDHFGVMGYAQHGINWQRIVGIAFVAMGVVLIRRF